MELKEIETLRLTLRKTNLDEWKSYIDHVMDANEIYLQYGYEPTPGLIDYIQEPTPEVIYYSIIDNDMDTMVGYIGILEENDNIEFYTFNEYRNNHYCTEALEVFMKAYLNGEMTGMPHSEIAGETLYSNEASIHILKKAGFKKEAVGFRFEIDEKTKELSSSITLRRYVYRKNNTRSE